MTIRESRVHDAAKTSVWQQRLLIGCLVGLGGWIAVLSMTSLTLGSATTVRHWLVTWIVLDVVEVCALAVTVMLIHRQSPAVASAAAVTATLFAVDAWFDVSTAQTGWDYFIAFAVALVFEVPLAILCARISFSASARVPA